MIAVHSPALAELVVYPVKGAGGTRPRTAHLTSTGLRHDREFMLVTMGGRHLSQRELPRMALLRPTYDGETITVGIAPPRGGPRSPRPPLVHSPVDNGRVHEVTVHGTRCRGVDQGDAPADWFTAALGTACRLVRFTGRRPTGRGGGEVAFADGYPLLLISAESLADLNGRLAEPLPMNRFRPNLVVSGLGPFGEDAVRLLRIGNAIVELVKPCARCLVTTTDQDTGIRGPEPLRTLAAYRTAGQEIRFGQNAIPCKTDILRVGDRVEILDTF